jgi:hypothetical protein
LHRWIAAACGPDKQGKRGEVSTTQHDSRALCACGAHGAGRGGAEGGFKPAANRH